MPIRSLAPAPRPAPLARRRRQVAALAAAVALVAAGCTSAASAEEAEPTAAATHEGGQVPFGRPFEYADGLFLQIKSPLVFTPTSQAEGIDEAQGEPVRIRFTITNGTRQAYTPHTLSASVVSDGVTATQVIDPGLQIGLTGPSTELRTANVVSFDLAFVVADPDDVTLTVVPALGGYEPLVLVTD